MKPKLAKLLKRRSLRYLLVGAAVYVLEVAIILLAQAHGVRPVRAVAASFIIGTAVSFLLQKLVTFGDKRLHHRVVIPQLVATGLLVAFNFGFTLLVVKLLAGVLPAFVCRTLALGVTTIWNFYLYRTRIFNWKKADKAAHDAISKIVRWRRLIKSRRFAIVYAIGAVAVLLATTAYWGLLSARLQLGNADQLVNVYLFQHHHTFQEAVLPGQHSFLIKWPLFWLVAITGATATAYIVYTVAVTMLTVGFMVWLLYYFERRPLVFGTLCLALASVLLTVPAVPYSGALLPANMAMITTRNLEYVVYIASLMLLIRSWPGRASFGTSFKAWLVSWQVWLALALMVLLIASDNLFLIISLGGSVLALAAYGVLRNRRPATAAAVAAVIVLVAGILATGLLSLINAIHITTVVSHTATGPYGIIHDIRHLAVGAVYVVLGTFTNFGANPAYDAPTLGTIPQQAYIHLSGAGGLAYVINAAVMLAGIAVLLKLVFLSLTRRPSSKASRPDRRELLVVSLFWASLAAAVVFMLSNHYYRVDARYLAIELFAVTAGAAVYARQFKWPPEKILPVGLLLMVGVLQGLTLTAASHAADTEALAATQARNGVIAAALRQHPVDTLVGDYWRVVPIKLRTGGKQPVTPLASCIRPRNDLSSRDWQPDLHHKSFAYLLTLEPGLTDYPACSLDTVTLAYGRPNSSIVIAGKVDAPRELLLFYDHGIFIPSKLAGRVGERSANTVIPVSLGHLPHTVCNGPTTMVVVAHQDDDLLFMNPDLQNAIRSGGCVRTVYVTAGDAGGDTLYWLGREKGSKAAYDYMGGQSAAPWVDRIAKIGGNKFLTIASPMHAGNLSLIFMHLPDGNLTGSGFAASRHESLERLDKGEVSSIEAVDRQSAYTSDQLVAAMADLMTAYQPAQVWTQAPFNLSDQYPDHSDHMAVGRFAERAFMAYRSQAQDPAKPQAQAQIRYYTGYPIRGLPENVFGADLSDKQSAFFAYGKYDGGVCDSLEQCYGVDTYRSYLSRQYQSPQ